MSCLLQSLNVISEVYVLYYYACAQFGEINTWISLSNAASPSSSSLISAVLELNRWLSDILPIAVFFVILQN